MDDQRDVVGEYTEQVIRRLGYYPWESTVFTVSTGDWRPSAVMDTFNSPKAISQWRHIPSQLQDPHPVMMVFCRDPKAPEAGTMMLSAVARISLPWEDVVLITPEGWSSTVCERRGGNHFHSFDVRSLVGETIYPDYDTMLAAWKYDPDNAVSSRPVELTEERQRELVDALADPRGLPPDAAEHIIGWMNTPARVNQMLADCYVQGYLVDNLTELVKVSNAAPVLNFAAMLLLVDERVNRVQPVLDRLDRLDRSPEGREQVASLKVVQRDPAKQKELQNLARTLGDLRAQQGLDTRQEGQID